MALEHALKEAYYNGDRTTQVPNPYYIEVAYLDVGQRPRTRHGRGVRERFAPARRSPRTRASHRIRNQSETW